MFKLVLSISNGLEQASRDFIAKIKFSMPRT